MTKYIFYGVAGIFFLGMTVFNVSNFKTLKKHESTISVKNKKMVALTNSLDGEKLENEILLDRNLELEAKVVELRDSISRLKYEISNLKGKFSDRKSEILALRAQIEANEAKYAQLKQEITEATEKSIALSKNIAEPVSNTSGFTTPMDNGRGGLEFALPVENTKGSEALDITQQESYELLQKERDMAYAKIKRLEDEKLLLRKELDNLYFIKTEKLTEAKEIKEVIKDRTESTKKFEKLTMVVNETIVKFNKVSVRKARYGKPLNKINSRNWKYTVIEISLDGPHLDLLLNNTFIVKIVNTDTQEIVNYIDKNPNYPYNSTDKDGIDVAFDGNLIEIAHHNNLKKTGENYEIQVNYVDKNGEEFTLLNGVTQFIKDGVSLIN